MYDWLFEVVRYARTRPDLDFVLRAHPAEAKLPAEYQTGLTACTLIRQECAPLPENLVLLEGGHALSSYALAAASAVVMVYTSTLGIEFALRDIRPWVAAGPYYAGKGFTLDLDSSEHMRRLLDEKCFSNVLTASQVELAERLAHLVRFRNVFSFPYLTEQGRFTPPDFSVFAPGGDPIFERLCDCLLTGRSFLDVAADRPAPPREELACAAT